MNDQEKKQLLMSAKTIAVVGLSNNPDSSSHGIGKYLQRHGYKVIPVNPNESEVLGEKSYASLRGIPEHVDIVDVFRKPEAVPAIADEAIAIGAGTLWLQLGIIHNEAAAKAEAAGLKVIQDECIAVDHRMLI